MPQHWEIFFAHSLADPGDAILVSRPMYGRFEIDFGIQAGVSIVYADTEPEEAFSPEVVQKFEDALVKSETEGRRIRAVGHQVDAILQRHSQPLQTSAHDTGSI